MTFLRLRRFAVFVMCTSVAVGVAGCGDSTVEVTGTITLKGEPPELKGLDIGFLGSNGRLVTAPINRDGTYKAVGVPVGDVLVSFIYTPPSAAQSSRKGRLPQPGSPEASSSSHPRKQQPRNPIPPHLGDGSTSGLSLKVMPRTPNVFNYDVQP